MLAKSFARIHVANLINAGILPLTFSNPEDYEKLNQGDALLLSGIESGMAAGVFTLVDKTNGAEIPVQCSLTERQKAILMAGGLLNYTKENGK